MARAEPRWLGGGSGRAGDQSARRRPGLQRRTRGLPEPRWRGRTRCLHHGRSRSRGAGGGGEAGRHVLLVGEGARRFAAETGIEECASEALIAERQRARWAASQREKAEAPGTVGGGARDRGGPLCDATLA